jgi:hypothetical protein
MSKLRQRDLASTYVLCPHTKDRVLDFGVDMGLGRGQRYLTEEKFTEVLIDNGV